MTVPSPQSDDNPDPGSGRASPGSAPPPAPRWLKVFAVVLVVILLLAAVALATGLGGEHGPSRHMPSIGTGCQAPVAEIGEDGAFSGSALLQRLAPARIRVRTFHCPRI